MCELEGELQGKRRGRGWQGRTLMIMRRTFALSGKARSSRPSGSYVVISQRVTIPPSSSLRRACAECGDVRGGATR